MDVMTEHFCHITWKDNKYDGFFEDLKNNSAYLQNITNRILQAILIYNRNGLVWNNINIQSLYFPIIKGNLQPNRKIKIGDLFNHFSITDKQQFLSMPILYRNPPEILNLISFNRAAYFDRDSLEYITYLNEEWKIDVWALGILILEILNGGPLKDEGCKINELINLQKNIVSQNHLTMNKLDYPMKIALLKM